MTSSKQDSLNNPKDNLLRWLFNVALFSLIPFIFFLFKTVPCSDDFFYHNYAQGKTLTEFLVDHYNTWTGRYFSNFLMAVSPFTLTSNLDVYPWMTVSIFILFAVSSYFFFYQIILFFPTKQPGLKSLYISTIVIGLFFHKMPRVSDTFYWYPGSSAHLIALSFCLICIGLLLTRGTSKKISLASNMTRTFLISLLSFFICGSNETIAMQWIFILFFIFGFFRFHYRKWEWTLIFPLSISIFGFLIMFFAPGTAIRAAALKTHPSVLLTLVKPWGLLIETSIRYLSLNLIILCFWLAPYSVKFNNSIPLLNSNKKIKILLSFFCIGTLVLTFVPSVWTMGGLPPRRVLNNSYFFFLVFMPFLIVLWAKEIHFWHSWQEKLDNILGLKWQKAVIAIGFFLTFNNFTAWNDVFHYSSFLKSWQHRLELIHQNKKMDLAVPELNYFPETFYYEDITTDPADYRNTNYIQFFDLKSIVIDSSLPK